MKNRHMRQHGRGIFTRLGKVFKGGYKKLKEQAMRGGKDFYNKSIRPELEQIAGTASGKLMNAGKRILIDTADNITAEVVQNPKNAVQILSDNFKNASSKTKKEIKDTISATKDLSRESARNIQKKSMVSLSNLLGNSNLDDVPLQSPQEGSGLTRRQQTYLDRIAPESKRPKMPKTQYPNRLHNDPPSEGKFIGKGPFVLGKQRGSGPFILGKGLQLV